MPDIGVLGMVPDNWLGPRMSRHQIMTRLARYFHVVWAEPARGWRVWVLDRVVARRPAEATGMPGFHVHRLDRWIPRFYRPRALASFADRLRLRRAQRVLRSLGCHKTVLHVWRPEFAKALDVVPHDISCYHMVDEYSFADVEHPIDPAERRLIERVDQVIIHSAALMEKKGHINPNTLVVPNGVDYLAYATPCEEPADLSVIPRPRIGYVGILKRQLDFELILQLARRHREWSFVFVGPRGYLREDLPRVQELAQMPNVFFLGARPVTVLPSYMQHLDVCTMCYDLTDYASYIYPLKLHEYLAAGRPVVGTPIRTLLQFQEAVTVARTVEQWSAALMAALAPAASAPSAVDARRLLARQHDWDRLAETVARAFCERLGRSFVEVPRRHSVASHASLDQARATGG